MFTSDFQMFHYLWLYVNEGLVWELREKWIGKKVKFQYWNNELIATVNDLYLEDGELILSTYCDSTKCFISIEAYKIHE